MDGRRLGVIVRAVRQHLRLRQADLAVRAQVSQRWLSDLELGRMDSLNLPAVDRVCRVLDVSVRIEARWRGGDVDRLLDRDHAAIVERVVAVLRHFGWEVRLEYGFNHYGDRGSVDVLAWHAPTRTLLIIEVKSRLTDLQATLASLARKLRIVPVVVQQDGWAPERSVHLLVVLGSTANRRVVEAHPEIFDVSFPNRTRRVREWLASPTTPLRGLWFVTPGSLRRRGPIGRARVRRSASRAAAPGANPPDPRRA